MWRTKQWISIFIVMALTASLASCKKKDLKTLAAIVAVGIAAKVIYDMIIEHRAEQITNDSEVIKRYKEQNRALPPQPELVAYTSTIKPGSLVSPGSPVSIQSNLEVVRGISSEAVVIEERITIYDNEDPTKELKSLVKTVNQDTTRCGEFVNEFTFTLPKGMPQGVYPVKTAIIIDGKELAPVENKMQLVTLDSLLLRGMASR